MIKGSVCMVTYDLIDSRLKDYHIKGHKYVCLISFILIIVLIFLSDLSVAIVVLLPVITLVNIVFFITYNINRRKYGKKLSFCNGIITVYDYKNHKIKELHIDTMKYRYLNVAFIYERPRCYQKCLVLYENIVLYENMEYSSYWNDSEIVIIQNPQLIDFFRAILKENKPPHSN